MEWFKSRHRREREKIDSEAAGLIKRGILVYPGVDDNATGTPATYDGAVIAGPVISDFSGSSLIGSSNGAEFLDDSEQQQVLDLFTERDRLLHTDQILLKDNKKNTRRKSLPKSRQTTIYKFKRALRRA